MTRESGPIVVFGGSGYVGRRLVPDLRARGEVVAPSSAEVDVADAAAVESLLRRVEPRAVINLAARNPGQGGEEAMAAVNHFGAANVARAAVATGARVIHMSTDIVLDGKAPPYADDAPPAPLSGYGRTKAAGETAVLELCPDAVTVRTSLVWDPAEMDRSTRGFADRLERGEPCALFVDEIRCPISRPALTGALIELQASPFTGRINVAGAEPVSRFVYGTRLLEWFGVPGRERVTEGRAAELAQPRPLDLTLDLSRARAVLGMPPPGFTEELDRARAEGETP